MNQITRRRALGLTASALGASLLAQPARTASHSHMHVVEIRGHAFHPAALTIAAGDTVEFVNMDRAPHTATHTGGAFDTGRLGRNQRRGLRFTSPGRFGYFCAIHPSMKGEIVVA